MELQTTNSYQTLLLKLSKLVGNTPLYPIRHELENSKTLISAKLEWLQFGGSVKSRPAFNIIKKAILSGELDESKTLLDASSGNTAIAYASFGAALKIPVTICLPANASRERKNILNSLGAEIIYTSSFGSTDEAQEVANRLQSEFPNKYFYANQYNNPNNWLAHYEGTAEEIWNQTAGQITHFVTGLGTTGSFAGISKRLKELNPGIKTVGLQPDSALHILEGWKHLETAKRPGILKEAIIDEIIEIDSSEAMDAINLIAKTEGLLVSPSAAANFIGATKVADGITKGHVVTLFPDNAEKYSEIVESSL